MQEFEWIGKAQLSHRGPFCPVPVSGVLFVEGFGFWGPSP